MHFRSPNLFPSPLREESPCRRGREAELRVACVFTHVIWRCCVWRLRFISDSWNFSACKLLKTETILFSHSIKSARGKSEYLKHRNLYFRFDGLVDFSFAFHWWKAGPGRCELGDSGQRTWTLHFHVPRVLSEGAVRTGEPTRHVLQRVSLRRADALGPPGGLCLLGIVIVFAGGMVTAGSVNTWPEKTSVDALELDQRRWGASGVWLTVH